MSSRTLVAPLSICVGLIGSGIQKSRTPAMHVEEGRRLGIDYRYDLIDLDVLGLGTEALSALIDKAEREGFAGLNITHPCKQAAVELVDELSADGSALGAINTLVFKSGRRIGHNTDWWGFARSFERGLADAPLAKVAVVGAGGAGAAVTHALATLGAETICIFDLRTEKAEEVIELLSPIHPKCRFVRSPSIADAIQGADGVAHATPTGMTSHPGMPFDADLLRDKPWVAEIVYFPLQTDLLRAAAACGCRTLNGGGMAVYQAVSAFRLFSGNDPDPERMIKHFASLGEGGGI